jgi:hypothetical protein
VVRQQVSGAGLPPQAIAARLSHSSGARGGQVQRPACSALPAAVVGGQRRCAAFARRKRVGGLAWQGRQARRKRAWCSEARRAPQGAGQEAPQLLLRPQAWWEQT